jgi:hypothetical protein
MVTIAWNPLRFSLIVALPKGHTFNAECNRDNVLASLLQFQPEDDGREFVVHADNARAQAAQKFGIFCEENGPRLAPHPSYSPDLVPSVVFLLGYVTERFKEMVFPSYKELLDAIRDVVTASSRRRRLPCLNSGWRDWNGCLRTMVITIYKLPVGSFAFFQCRSGTELLNLSGTPYINQ